MTAVEEKLQLPRIYKQTVKMALYDLCIVGAGMMGSAAARHASEKSGVKVCLIGPQEPKIREIVSGNEVFGTHYDEGRIMRATATSPLWADLAKRSEERYRELENLSGVQFYHEIGALTVGTRYGQFIGRTKSSLKGGPKGYDNVEILAAKELNDKFPYLTFADNDEGIMEKSRAGYINPRKMVMAQIVVAVNQGCDVIRDIVLNIEKLQGVYKLTTERGKIIWTKKVLLATNAFTGMHQLLKNPVSYKAMPQTVTLAAVSENTAKRLSQMPVVLYEGKGGESWSKTYPRDSSDNIQFYLLPPIKYPDGKYYIKIGHSDDILKGSLELTDIRKWYSGKGDEELEEELFKLLDTIFHGVRFENHHGDACATMVTPGKQPYIDLLSPTLAVALGGNGYAAKSSDEIGRIAADLILTSKWTYDIPKENFKVKFHVPSKL
ncbi:uncharacterized protein LOC133181490 [Saccostrea echinata]|uniref:uncharacterized protein LOC133181490 n=1 Tax=Saccostrea echinata TaxID=191078 RepID=UPI002A82C584|nr:uncharacterized protein LOC133181490 [Saccostrea echinata]